MQQSKENEMKNWLQDKYVILTGASSGIGRELCKILIEKYHAKVSGVGRREEKMLSLLRELGDKAEYLQDLGFKTTFIWIHGLLTDSQYDAALKKLQKMLAKAAKPKEG
jgi:NAD(P)-dependent dehydrogenase (short-subunit alcohol dehydrogenase family)